MKLSIIAPIYNEEGNINELYKQIYTSVSNLKASNDIKNYEIIFINDGSTDRSLELMKKLSQLTIIDFRKNFGQTAALDAGIKASTGDVLITLDGDLQNDPADFKLLISKLEEGYDVVSGWRSKRKDSFSKKFLSRGANILRKILVDDGIHDSGCTLKAYRKECFDQIDLQGEMHRFIPALLKVQGFKITEVKVNHRARINGKTKYNWKRVIKGLLDMVSIWFWRKYSARPLHIFGGLGIISLAVGSLLIALAIVDKLMFKENFIRSALFPLGLQIGLAGIILLVSGIIADVCIKTYYSAEKRRPYNIKSIINTSK